MTLITSRSIKNGLDGVLVRELGKPVAEDIKGRTQGVVCRSWVLREGRCHYIGVYLREVSIIHLQKKYQLINTGNLSAAIEKGSLDKNKVITAEDLVTCGLTKTKGVGIKILASGELTYKINIEVDKASKSAISMIESKGGKVILASDRSKNVAKTKGNQKEAEENKASTPDA